MALKDLMNIAPVRKYLLEDPILDIYEKIFTERGYPQERRKELLDLTNAIIDGTLPPKAAAGIIEEAFTLDEKAAKQLACDVLGYDLLPLEIFVSGIPDAIRELGCKVEDYPSFRVGKEKLSSLAWANRLCTQLQITFSPVLLKRFALLLDGRASGEKSVDTLRTFLSRPLTIGGLELPKEKGDAVLSAVEAEVPYIEIISEEEYKKEKEEEAPPPSEEEEEDEAREMKEMDERFALLTKTAPKESIKPIMPGARVSAARALPAPKPKPQGEEATLARQMLRPKPAKAELTVGSVPPRSPERKVTDVVPAARLMGPVDQLRSMSPAAFRRLSGDPGEAAQKVIDLLSALEATGYEEKVAGIKAWRQSSLNQLYLEMTEEALQKGTSVTETATTRRKEGRDSLSPAEIKAIVALNAKLRF